MRNQVEKIINMVNLVTAYCSMLRWGMMKIAGVRPYTVEIEPGTVMRFWVPSETPLKPKPVVVLLHGFCGDGIMTWQFQVGALTKNYAVYVPDFLFFGSSGTDRPERSVAFQAECLAAGLRKLGVEKCIVVGFSYGGMVAFNMAEMYPELVQAVVVSGSCVAIMESIITTVVEEAGFSSCSDMLLPTSVEGLRALLSIGAHKNLAWFPNRFYRDFLEVCHIYNHKIIIFSYLLILTLNKKYFII